MELSNEQYGRRSKRAMDFSSASRIIGAIFDAERGEESAAADLPTIPGYTLVRRLGSGGGGDVFLGTRDLSGEALAVKLIKHAIGDTKADARTWRELDLLADLRLAGVPEVKDYGLAGNRIFLATTHVEGLTLVDHCHEQGFDHMQRVELMVRIAHVVQQLHEHGIIHRDIKPDNIIIQPDGSPVVVDFGIAALFTGDLATTLTEEGRPVGTVGFMAPEQARGERVRLSTRSDVFGLGATLCYLLTGQTPHDVKTALHEAIRRVAQDGPRDPRKLDPTIPTTLARIIAKACSAHPEDRYPSAALFAEDLAKWLNDEPIDWQQPTWFRRQVLALRRNPRMYLGRAAVLTVFLALFGTSAFASARWQAERTNARTQAELRQKAEELAAKLTKSEEEQTAMLQEQIDAIEFSQQNAMFFDATLELWALGQEIQKQRPDDKALIDTFVSHVSRLIDAARAVRATQPATRGETKE